MLSCKEKKKTTKYNIDVHLLCLWNYFVANKLYLGNPGHCEFISL